MANTIVTDVTNMMLGAVTGIKDSLDVNKELSSGSDDFSKVMNTASEKLNVNSSSDVSEQLAAKSTSVDKSATRNIKSEIKSENNNVNTDEQADDQQIVKKVVEVSQKVVDKIKDTFGMSDEELEEAMLNMGIGLQDLLNPAKLSELMMNLAGAEDSIALITDANAYFNVKSVVDFTVNEISELKREFGVTDDQLSELLNDTEGFEAVLEELKADMNTSEMQMPEVPEEAEAIINEETTHENSEIEVNLQAADNKISVEVKKSDEPSEAAGAEITQKSEKVDEADLGNTESFKEVTNKNAAADKEPLKDSVRVARFERSSIENSQLDNNGSSFSQTVTTQTEVNTVGDIVETVTTYTNVDANEIASQVAQSIRVNITAESASLEMQLHPASLGTVNMQVSSANGVVTANIIVQSEAVKAALESQLIILQESFEEQGQKVDAVEVTVANYDMNQNMNRDNGQNESERREKESFRVSGARRRINLNDFAEDDTESLTEEERITKDMMERNGNKVDYMA